MIRLCYVLAGLTLSGLVAYSQEGDWTPKPPPEFPVEMDDLPHWLWEQMKQDPLVKEHFGFKLAFCQHPMYLLIDEDRGDPPVGERIPPWGAPTSAEYVERVKRNLESLESFPDIKLNYQWSAYELNHMIEAHPDVYQKTRELFENGSLDFLDGTYSQAHLHVLGSESNWKQFEYGLEVYREKFGKAVDVYSRQETGLHRQLSQLLKKFGYRYMTTPSFHAAVEVNGGKFEFLVNDQHYLPLAGQEFVLSEALDGSSIPAYLWMSPEEWEQQTDQFEMDLYSGPKIFYEFPDLEEVDQELYNEYQYMYDWVLLGDALDERFKVSPPTATASIHSYWSYLEGVWAEALMRNNRLTEESAVLAGQIEAMGGVAGTGHDVSTGIKSIWKEVLKSQHHDISWIEVTDLKTKSIARLRESRREAEQIMGEIAGSLVQPDPNSLAVFNGLPRERSCLLNIDGNRSLENITLQEYRGIATGFATVPSGGFRSFHRKGKAKRSVPGALPGTIEAEGYKAELDEEGLIRQISVNGKELLSDGEFRGGELRARIRNDWVNNREAETRYLSGPVFDIVERTTSLGHIPVKERYFFFKEKPLIKVELDFEFHGDEVGNMWMDQTKINVYYPTRGDAVYHDIPFGYIEARQERPLYATNWVSCGGLVYIHRGTIKHRVKEGVIANVLAWGSNHYSNRLHWDYWTSQAQYDIRLYGNHTLEYYIMPVGEFDGNSTVKEVTDLISPVFVTPGKGERSFYTSDDPMLAPTSVYLKEGNPWMRGYKLPGEGGRSGYRDWEIFNEVLTE